MSDMGAECHTFLAAGSNDVGIAQLNVLGCQSHRSEAQTRSTLLLFHAGFSVGRPSLIVGLSRRVFAAGPP